MGREGLYTNNQYNVSYLARLARVSKDINLCKFINHNKDVKILKGLGQLDERYKKFVVIGIFIIDCKNKETIFDECSLIVKPKEQKAYEDMAYFIEDHSGKIQIHLEDLFSINKLPVPGQVLGFLLEYTKRKIYLKDILYPERTNKITEENVQKSIARGKAGEEIVTTRKICFIANPEIDDQIETLKLIVARLFEEKQPTDIVIIGKMCLDNSKKQIGLLITFLKSLNVQLHIIPNIGDPTNGSFPLNPIKKRIFNIDAQFYSSPAQLNINYSFQFIPEQSITSIRKYFPKRSTRNILQNILHGRIICPTAPDTIGCVPYDIEPFYMENAFQYIFTIGDDLSVEKLQTEELVEKEASQNSHISPNEVSITCFTVPKYSRTKKIVFLDCETQEIEGYELKYDL